MNRLLGDSLEGSTAMSAALGGTISGLSGGDFKNGAMTAAFAHLYNDLQYHGKTDPVTGETHEKAVCFDECVPGKAPITGGKEANGHTKNSFHPQNKAIDVSTWRNPLLTDENVAQCASKCGFTHWQKHWNRKYKVYSHWHLQIGEGNGLGAQDLIPRK